MSLLYTGAKKKRRVNDLPLKIKLFLFYLYYVMKTVGCAPTDFITPLRLKIRGSVPDEGVVLTEDKLKTFCDDTFLEESRLKPKCHLVFETLPITISGNNLGS